LRFDEIDLAFKGSIAGNFATACLVKGEIERGRSLMKQALEILDALKSPDAAKFRGVWDNMGIEPNKS
jgi:hypothetical protein